MVSGIRPGSSIGRYSIVEELGRGGMGTVYLAADSTLGRNVALKLLPQELSDDPDRLARFRREAQVLARFRHPNVATIHSIEEDGGMVFLTMEHVRGRTIADRLAEGPLSVGEALRICAQVARGIEEAHSHGVVHCDLKPRNICLDADGSVKVLDFGLATMERAGSDSEIDPGRGGMVLGSPGYMSPEQLRGESAGTESDLWAFGCLLYECLGGRAAFPGPTPLDRMHATLHATPDWAILPKSTPRDVRGLLQQCFQRDREARSIQASRAAQVLEASLRRADRPRRRGLWAVALFALAAVVAWFAVRDVGDRSPLDPSRFRQFTSSGEARSGALSPDGERMCYVDGGILEIRDLDSGRTTDPVPELSFVGSPSWSPDAKSILFVAKRKAGGSDRHLYRLDLERDAVADLGRYRAACWSPGSDSLATIPGGERIVLFPVDSPSDSSGVALDPRAVARLDSRLRIHNPTRLVWHPAGRLLIGQGPQILSIGFDGLLEAVRDLNANVQWMQLDPARDALYLTVSDGDDTSLRRLRLDPRSGDWDGEGETLLRYPRAERVSVDRVNGRVAVSETVSEGWLWVLEKGSAGWKSRPLQRTSGALAYPRFSPDGATIAYLERSGESAELCFLPLVSTGRALRRPVGEVTGHLGWSPDGRSLAFVERDSVSVMEIESGKARRLPIASTRFMYWRPHPEILVSPESGASYLAVDPVRGTTRPCLPPVASSVSGTMFQAAVSPDLRWIAVAGNRPTIQDPVRLWLVSLVTGTERLLWDTASAPIGWSPDGEWVFHARELYSEDARVPRSRVQRTSIDSGRTELVAELPLGRLGTWSNIDVSPDGRHIVCVSRNAVHDVWLAESAQFD